MPSKTVFTSTSSNQLAREGQEYGGGYGLFTCYLLQGSGGEADADGDGRVTLGELFPYVSEKVRRETSDAQTPQVSGKFDTTLSIGR